VYQKVEPEDTAKDFNNRFEQWKQSHDEWFQECTQNLMREPSPATWDRVNENSTPSRKSAERPK
jgi:sugar-specific transcriptional regulator TrmB